MFEILTNETANGSSDPELITDELTTLGCWGTFDGATVQLEASLNGGSDWISTAELTFTAPALTALTLGAGVLIRGTVSSAGVSTDVSLWVQ